MGLSKQWGVAFVCRCLTMCVGVGLCVCGRQNLFMPVKTTPLGGDTSRDEVGRWICNAVMHAGIAH